MNVLAGAHKIYTRMPHFWMAQYILISVPFSSTEMLANLRSVFEERKPLMNEMK